MWQYTGILSEHNKRVEEANAEEVTQPWTADEYKQELEALRQRDDPRIRV